jgi:putative ABC transport system permease protein
MPGWISIERFLQDIRFAARSLRKNVLFSVVAIATFALGIGANTAIFSVANAILLRPLPYPHPGAIVHLNLTWKNGGSNDALTVPEFEFYRDRCRAFQAMAGIRGGATVSLKRGDVPEWITSLHVSDGFFQVLGVHPVMGRAIERDDTRPGGPPVAVLSDSLWRSAFAADPGIIGRQIEIDSLPYLVVGILPPKFTFIEQPADVFVPLQLGRTIADTGMNTRVIARLNPSTSIEQAQANTNVVFEEFRQQGLAQSGQRGIQIESYQRWLAGDFRSSVLMLFGAVSLLLLIACANVASLLMARASSRQREISIRLAIGSERLQLLQQFLAESLLIVLLGSVAGLLAASWALRTLISSIPWNMPLTNHVGLDTHVLVFTSLIALGTALVFGLTSYWQSSRVNLNSSLKESGPGGWRQAARNRARSFLVVAEIAISVMLLVGAGLLIDTMYRLHQQKLGFNPDRVYTMTTPFGPSARLTAVGMQNFEQDVLHRIQSTPGVTSAAIISDLPLTGPDNLPTQQAGHPEHSIGGMEYRAISPQYFRTMQIFLVEGRAFEQSDTTASTPVAIVSESVARAWWNGKSPIGDRIVVGEYQGRQFPEVLEQPREVVGVVADVKNLAVDEAVPTTIYVPLTQLPRVPGSLAWIVKGSGDRSLGAVLRDAVTTVRPDQRILNLESMSDIVARSVARPSFNAWLMAAFAILALTLTSVGIYGLLSFQVAGRIQEIGIRMALGAERASVLLMVLKQGVSLAVIGLVLGAGAAFVLTRLLVSQLAGVKPANPLIYVMVCTLLLLVAIIASYLPARRASKVDPILALRQE